MFVFAALSEETQGNNIDTLADHLKQAFTIQNLPILFTNKDNLLTSRHENVSFYVAIINDKSELKDWIQMAKDFELTIKPNPISIIELTNRFQFKKSKFPNLYSNEHYGIGETIFKIVKELSPGEIYLYF